MVWCKTDNSSSLAMEVPRPCQRRDLRVFPCIFLSNSPFYQVFRAYSLDVVFIFLTYHCLKKANFEMNIFHTVIIQSRII